MARECRHFADFGGRDSLFSLNISTSIIGFISPAAETADADWRIFHDAVETKCLQFGISLAQVEGGRQGHEKWVRNPSEAGVRHCLAKQTNPPRQTLSTAILQCLTLGFPTTRENQGVSPGIISVVLWNRVVAFQDCERGTTT